MVQRLLIPGYQDSINCERRRRGRVGGVVGRGGGEGRGGGGGGGREGRGGGEGVRT